MINYYDLPEVSSSDLGKFRRIFYGVPDPEGLEEIFAFGSLVDAMLTERHKLNATLLSLREDDGRVIEFTVDVWRLAERLERALRKDPIVKLMLPGMIGQYIFRRTLTFRYNDEEHTIRARCKFDLFSKVHKTGLEFKTTSCKTLNAFIASIDRFDYDKAAAWYMDLARIDRHWIVAICKTTDEIFKVAVERGDDNHTRGQAKYKSWAYRWNLLITPFEQQLIKVA